MFYGPRTMSALRRQGDLRGRVRPISFGRIGLDLIKGPRTYPRKETFSPPMDANEI